MERRTFHKGSQLIYIEGKGIFGSNFIGTNLTWVIDEDRARAIL